VPYKIEETPLLKAKILTVFLTLADEKRNVDFKSESINQLWAINGVKEDHLFELNKLGAIHFEMLGEDGFAPIVVGGITSSTHDHLLNCLAQLGNDKNLLEERITLLLTHNPQKLKSDIESSKKHISEAMQQISSNEILKPLLTPLQSIETHFNSISRVAEIYDDVYKNILRPVQEEGRSGVKATVKWAIISIIASWMLTNYSEIEKLVLKILS
jgi:hypothetical protein